MGIYREGEGPSGERKNDDKDIKHGKDYNHNCRWAMQLALPLNISMTHIGLTE